MGASQLSNISSRGLDVIFTQQTVLNSILAVISGFISQYLADYINVESVFNLAAVVAFVATFLLEENKGKSDVTVLQNLIEGTSIVLSRKWLYESYYDVIILEV